MAYSIGTSLRSNQMKQFNHFVPGPGKYENDKMQKHTPIKWKLGTSQRKEVSAEYINRSPGPTKYNVNFNEMEKKNISLKYKLNYPIDYNLRIDKERPGPGSYENNFNIHFKTQPQFTFGLKTKDIEQLFNDTPGPGTYKLNPQNESTNIIFNKSKSLNKTLTYLGPGQYNPNYLNHRSKSPDYSFSKETRAINVKENQEPGPGDYNLKDTFQNNDKKGALICSRIKTQDDRKFIPGPGQYHINASFNKVLKSYPKYQIGKEQRFCRSLSPDVQQVPGPGHYNPNLVNPGSPRQPTHVIGTSKRPQPHSMNNQNPGPGQYDLRKANSEGPQYQFGLKNIHLKNTKDEFPGPTDYSPNKNLILKNEPTIGMEKQINKFKPQLGPGPGEYTIPVQTSIQYSFSKQNKETKHLDNQVPGPGQYTLKNTFGQIPNYLKNGSPKPHERN